MRTKTTFIADDGKIFDTARACSDYELSLYEAKRAETKARFSKHFSEVYGVSDEMTRYVTDSCEAWVYSFVPFEGWEDLLKEYVGCFEICYWGVENGSLKDGKKYFVFCNDSVAYLVDAEYLKEMTIKEIDAWTEA